jgi:hypothetical protein
MSTKKDEGFVRAAKDITAGSVGGIAQVLTGQPFDIVKVHPFPVPPLGLPAPVFGRLITG